MNDRPPSPAKDYVLSSSPGAQTAWEYGRLFDAIQDEVVWGGVQLRGSHAQRATEVHCPGCGTTKPGMR